MNDYDFWLVETGTGRGTAWRVKLDGTFHVKARVSAKGADVIGIVFLLRDELHTELVRVETPEGLSGSVEWTGPVKAGDVIRLGHEIGLRDGATVNDLSSVSVVHRAETVELTVDADLTVRCPDGGRCFHYCEPGTECWRVENTGPLAAAGKTWEDALQGRPPKARLEGQCGWCHEPLAGDTTLAILPHEEGVCRPPERPKTPVLDRIDELRPQTQVVGEFLDWLQSKGYVLGGHQYHPTCYLHDYNDEEKECQCELRERECWGLDEDCPDKADHVDWLWAVPIRDRSESHDYLLHEFFDIDALAEELERRAILEHIQQLNERETA